MPFLLTLDYLTGKLALVFMKSTVPPTITSFLFVDNTQFNFVDGTELDFV